MVSLSLPGKLRWQQTSNQTQQVRDGHSVNVPIRAQATISRFLQFLFGTFQGKCGGGEEGMEGLLLTHWHVEMCKPRPAISGLGPMIHFQTLLQLSIIARHVK